LRRRTAGLKAIVELPDGIDVYLGVFSNGDGH
jgi:hypothetical protein